MATGLNIVKTVNTLLQRRLTLIHELSEEYRPAVIRNKDKLIELVKEKAELASKSKIARKVQGVSRVVKGYYTVEMTPPSKGEMARLKADIGLAKEFIQSGCFKYLTVRQAWLLFLVCAEVGLWFYLGETVGKMHFVGYKV